jgi:hypothetical protein
MTNAPPVITVVNGVAVLIILVTLVAAVWYCRRSVFFVFGLLFGAAVTALLALAAPVSDALFAASIFVFIAGVSAFIHYTFQQTDRQAQLLLRAMPGTRLKLKGINSPQIYLGTDNMRIGVAWHDHYIIIKSGAVLQWSFSHQTDLAGKPLYNGFQGLREIEFYIVLNDEAKTELHLCFERLLPAAKQFEAALSARNGGRRGIFRPSTLPASFSIGGIRLGS